MVAAVDGGTHAGGEGGRTTPVRLLAPGGRLVGIAAPVSDLVEEASGAAPKVTLRPTVVLV